MIIRCFRCLSFIEVDLFYIWTRSYFEAYGVLFFRNLFVVLRVLVLIFFFNGRPRFNAVRLHTLAFIILERKYFVFNFQDLERSLECSNNVYIHHSVLCRQVAMYTRAVRWSAGRCTIIMHATVTNVGRVGVYQRGVVVRDCEDHVSELQHAGVSCDHTFEQAIELLLGTADCELSLLSDPRVRASQYVFRV